MQVQIHTGKFYVGIVANENVTLSELETAIRLLMAARRHLKRELALKGANK